MKIIKYKKISNNKYKIYFDNSSLVLYENVILKYNLLFKKEIDEDLLKEINKDNYKESIYDISIKYIDVRIRSKKELEKYLINKKYEKKDIDDTINKLLEKNILNDDLFCKSYIIDKFNLTNKGLDKIKNELINLGIDEKIIYKHLSLVDNNLILNKLNKIIGKQLKINSKFPINKIKNKIINSCINLGYKYEDIINVLENCKINSYSNIENDYNKLLNKYKNKYDCYKLQNIIKSKLYQKGYAIEEINEIINKNSRI